MGKKMNDVYSVLKSPSLSEIMQEMESRSSLENKVLMYSARMEGAFKAVQDIKARRKGKSELSDQSDALNTEYVRQCFSGTTPDVVNDTPKRARDRGYLFIDGEPVVRTVRNMLSNQRYEICKSDVYFAESVRVPCTYMLIPYYMLQPSHREGKRNWKHFIPEAQPKNRTDDVSAATAEAHAKKIEPRLLLDNYYAFSGAPVVNDRCEVIQGNGRADALRIMFDRYPNSIKEYLDTLGDWVIHNIDDDKTAQHVDTKFAWPVLVRMITCSDEEAIKLGRYSDSQITTGGSSLFDPDNVSMQLLCDKKIDAFSRIVFDAGDGNDDSDSSFRDFIRLNGNTALKWLCGHSYITSAEYNACIKKIEDGTKQITTKAIDAIHQIFTSTLFRNMTNGFEVMFDSLPVKAQAAIFETITRDFSMPDGKKLIPLIREAVEVYYHLIRKFQGFKKARNAQQAKNEIWMWENQSEMFASDKFPADKYSIHAKLLSVLFKVSSQSQIRNALNDIYDKMEGKGTPDMFSSEPFGVPQSLTDALNTVLGVSLNGINTWVKPQETVGFPAQYKSYKYWPRHHSCPAYLSEAMANDIFSRLVVPLSDALSKVSPAQQPYIVGSSSIIAFYDLTQYAPIDENKAKAALQKVIKRWYKK